MSVSSAASTWQRRCSPSCRRDGDRVRLAELAAVLREQVTDLADRAFLLSVSVSMISAAPPAVALVHHFVVVTPGSSPVPRRIAA